MSDMTAHYAATLLQSTKVLLFFGCVVCLWMSWRLFGHSRQLAAQQANKEEVRHLIDWTDSAKVRKKAFLFLILAPIAFLGWRLMPGYYPALGMLSDSRACMSNGESGELIASGFVDDDADFSLGKSPSQFTFRMKDGSAIICRLDEIDDAKVVEGQRYRITHGIRIS